MASLLTVDGLAEAARNAQAAHCRTPACQAELTISKAVDLQIAGASASNGLPRPIPRDRDARVAAAYHRLVRQSLPTAPAWCRRAAALMSRFGEPGTPSEVIVPIAVIDLASRLDTAKPGLFCARAIITAMPATPETEAAMRAAGKACEAAGARAHCSDIAIDRKPL